MKRVTAALLLAAVFLLLDAPVLAEVPKSTGWWWRGSRGAIRVKPPVVPQGGLWVASETSDALAVSALSARSLIGRIRLAIDSRIGLPAIRACRVDPGWEPVEGGPWEQRPTADCDGGQAAGVVDADGITFDVRSLRRDAVALVPQEGAEPFSVVFRPPDRSSVTLMPVAARKDESTSVPAYRRSRAPAPIFGEPASYAGPSLGHNSNTVPSARPTDDARSNLGRPVDGTTPAAGVGGGSRSPWALGLVGVVLAAWAWRARAAVAAAEDHPLAAPLRDPSEPTVVSP